MPQNYHPNSHQTQDLHHQETNSQTNFNSQQHGYNFNKHKTTDKVAKEINSKNQANSSRKKVGLQKTYITPETLHICQPTMKNLLLVTNIRPQNLYPILFQSQALVTCHKRLRKHSRYAPKMFEELKLKTFVTKAKVYQN